MTPYWSDENRGLAIYHGDCREVLPEFADDQFGSVITDPPYGIGFADWDIPPDSAILQECLRVSEGSVVMFGGAKMESVSHFVGLKPERAMVWYPQPGQVSVKSSGMHFNWQPVWGWRMPHDQDVFTCDVLTRSLRPKGRHGLLPPHRAMKPPDLMEQIVKAFGGRSTLDPYMGSGTTLAAAAKLGIPATGIEISEEYCAMSVARLAGGFLDSEPPHLFNQEETECTCS